MFLKAVYNKKKSLLKYNQRHWQDSFCQSFFFLNKQLKNQYYMILTRSSGDFWLNLEVGLDFWISHLFLSLSLIQN